MELLFFGNKKKIGLEIKEAGKDDCYFLKLWMNGDSYGDFKYKDRLHSCARNFKIFLAVKDQLNIDAFDTVNPFEVEENFLLIRKNDKLKPEERSKEFLKRTIYIRYMGRPLNDFSMLSFFINRGTFIWIMKDLKSQKEFLYQIKEEDIVDLMTSFIEWYESIYGSFTVTNFRSP